MVFYKICNEAGGAIEMKYSEKICNENEIPVMKARLITK